MLYEELQAILHQRAEMITALEDNQNSISGARAAARDSLGQKLNPFQADNMRVSIQFHAGRDRRAVVVFMRDQGFLEREGFGQYKAKRVAERAAATARPTRLGTAILQANRDLMAQDGVALGSDDALTTDEAQQLQAAYHPFVQDLDSGVTVVDANKLEKVLTLQEQPWDDELRILMNDRPVDQLSPGQRSSAMFPLVALSENVPLVIDQPEDNLDNRMVGTVLTRILADLKEKRQIIVATHNPNIVVGGDAEQVVVLDAVGARKAAILRTGCIDEPEIVTSVVEIMEGGKEAFEARQRRYAALLQN